MRGTGHNVTGFAAGLIAAPMVASDPIEYALTGLAAWLGGTAPDWLEMPYSKNGGRLSLIPHRRITHWVIPWALLFFGSASSLGEHPAALALFGFAIGGLTHLAMDIPNPAGIPLIHPWKRTSLQLWKSGQYEGLLMALFLVAAWGSYKIFPMPAP